MKLFELFDQRVDELVGVKKFAQMSHDDIYKYIEATFGDGEFDALGQGSNGIALGRGGTVYKFWFRDSAYEDFIAYCQEHQDNPFLPKFKSGIKELPAFFLRSLDAPDRIRYIKMERLSDDRKWLGVQVTKYPGRVFEIEDLCNKISRAIRMERGDYQNIVARFLLDFQDYEDEDEDEEAPPTELTPEFDLLIKTVLDLYHLGGMQRKHRLDLHSGNFLARGKQPVLLDPVANEEDLDLNMKIDQFANKIRKDSSLPRKAPARRTPKDQQ